MNVSADAVAMPPPLPSRRPSLREALGMLALYFGLQMLVGMVIALLLGLVLGIRFAAQGGNVAELVKAAIARPDTVAASMAATLVFTASITLWLVRRLWPGPWRLASALDGFGLVRPSHAAFYAAAMLLGVATPFLGGALTQWLAHGQPVTQEVAQLGRQASLLSRLALAGVAVSLGPLVEEVLFRGVLLSALLGWHRGPAIHRGYSRPRLLAAVAISAGLFGLVHLPELGYLWYAVPNLVLLGVAAAWLRLQSGSIWPAVLAHSANNLVAVAGWFLATHPSH
ncbi:MAG: CPBP family intramembrane metalloprotease [Xanthomonadaceae bacterium]|nr:CPBP family intramembrane metalloprotease [Xanthomonadaceae bacterium]